jgi:hypothetical protein
MDTSGCVSCKVRPPVFVFPFLVHGGCTTTGRCVVYCVTLQVSQFGMGQYEAAMVSFKACADIRRVMCDVPGDNDRPLRPWEDRLPHPELAASFVNVTVRVCVCVARSG